MTLTTEQFDQLTRDELLALVKELIPIVRLVPQLQQRITELEAEVEQLKSKLTNSRNSSQLPLGITSPTDQAINRRRSTGPLLAINDLSEHWSIIPIKRSASRLSSARNAITI